MHLAHYGFQVQLDGHEEIETRSVQVRIENPFGTGGDPTNRYDLVISVAGEGVNIDLLENGEIAGGFNRSFDVLAKQIMRGFEPDTSKD